MNKSIQSLVALLIAVTLLLSSCTTLLSTPAQEELPPGWAGTIAAQTMDADPVLAALRITATQPPPTSTPLKSSIKQSTLMLPVNTTTPVPSLTPIQSSIMNSEVGALNNPLPPIATSNEPCNAAEFIDDVTIPDYSIISPATKATKTWKLKNVGSCTWTTQYKLVLISGKELGSEPPYFIPYNVLPGDLVDLSVQFSTPLIPTCYSSRWMLEDPNGVRFGTGKSHSSAIWVIFTVGIPGTIYFAS